MADFALPTDLLASASNFGYWINLAIGIILSTIIGGIVLIVILQVFSKIFKEEISESQNAFVIVLIVSIVNYFGILGIVAPLLAMVPVVGAFIGVLLPLLIWIALLKSFFGGMPWLHILIIAVVFYGLTIFLIPMLVGMLAVYIPSF